MLPLCTNLFAYSSPLSCPLSRSGDFYCHLLPVPLEENSFVHDICVTLDNW